VQTHSCSAHHGTEIKVSTPPPQEQTNPSSHQGRRI